MTKKVSVTDHAVEKALELEQGRGSAPTHVREDLRTRIKDDVYEAFYEDDVYEVRYEDVKGVVTKTYVIESAWPATETEESMYFVCRDDFSGKGIAVITTLDSQTVARNEENGRWKDKPEDVVVHSPLKSARAPLTRPDAVVLIRYASSSEEQDKEFYTTRREMQREILRLVEDEHVRTEDITAYVRVPLDIRTTVFVDDYAIKGVG